MTLFQVTMQSFLYDHGFISDKELADYLDISEKEVSNYLNGDAKMPKFLIKKTLDFLEVTPEEYTKRCNAFRNNEQVEYNKDYELNDRIKKKIKDHNFDVKVKIKHRIETEKKIPICVSVTWDNESKDVECTLRYFKRFDDYKKQKTYNDAGTYTFKSGGMIDEKDGIRIREIMNRLIFELDENSSDLKRIKDGMQFNYIILCKQNSFSIIDGFVGQFKNDRGLER